MTKEAEDRCVAGDAPIVLHHRGRALPDRIAQLAATIMAVNFVAKAIATIEVVFTPDPDDVTFNREAGGRTLQAGEMFADIVAKLCIQRK